jgi:hypothetical protein
MNDKNTGGPAFAVAELANIKWEGMTLRDYFAAKAMQGIIASEQPGDEEFATLEMCARDAYKYADSMLKAREA